MKTLFKLLTLIILFSSCSDDLDIEPETFVTHYNTFKNEKDVAAFMYNIQTSIKEAYSENFWSPIHGTFNPENNLRNLTSSRWNVQDILRRHVTHDTGNNNWAYWYRAISNANLLLENIDKVDMPNDRKFYYKGIALFDRGLAYFNITRLFGDCPYIENFLDYGQKDRTPWKEILQKAIDDVVQSSEYLDRWDNQKDHNGQPMFTKQIPGKGASFALLADIYSWMHGFGGEAEYLQKAIDASNSAINSGEFSLESDYESVCTNTLVGRGNEVIFAIDGNIIDSPDFIKAPLWRTIDFFTGYGIDPNIGISHAAERAYYNISTDIVDNLYPDNDNRVPSYFYEYEATKNNPTAQGYTHLYKRREGLFIVSPWGSDYRKTKGDMVIYRLAGLILLRAELYEKAGNTSLAENDLNTIRSRAGISNYSTSEGSLKDAIFKEQERELLNEGHRWWDILRNHRYRELITGTETFSKQDVKEGALFYPYAPSSFRDNPKLTYMPFWSKNI